MPGNATTETNTESEGKVVSGEESVNTESLNKEENENSTKDAPEKKEESTKEIKEESFETAKDSTGGKFDTLTLVQEVAKMESKLEMLSSKKADDKDFYKNLSKHLTDDEMQLRFEDDQTSYIDAVNAAKEKWLKENSVDTSKETEALESAKHSLVVAQSIDAVLKDSNYKDFNFVKLQDFYLNDLTKKEQMDMDKGSSKDNLSEYFKKIHDEYKKRNPKNIKNVDAPNIPDASKASRTSIEDAQEIEQEQKQKKYMEKIGFRKL